MRFLLVLLLISACLPAQRRGEEQDILKAAVATFDGTLKLLDKKQLVLELAGEQSLTIVVNKKTQYQRGKQTIAAKEIRPGALVLVEARKVMAELVAVKVTVKDAQ